MAKGEHRRLGRPHRFSNHRQPRRRAPEQISEQSQDAQAGVLVKTRHSIVMESEDCFDLPGGAVPSANPDHFGRKAEQGAQITKVGILAGDGIPLLASGVPNSQVRGPAKSDLVDMRRPG